MNELMKNDNTIYRVLAEKNGKVLLIDCLKRNMPFWEEADLINAFVRIEETEFIKNFGDFSELSKERQKVALDRLRMVSGVLAFLKDDEMRNRAINAIAADNQISKQTLKSYLITYLIYQDKSALAPKEYKKDKDLTEDEKNYRYALNKYFYTAHKNSLNHTYIQMLRDRYTDKEGKLLDNCPSFYQFRYYYRKTKKLETYYISRNGIKDYQKNKRPLMGGGVQMYAQHSGIMGMVDSTVCDIYLINERGDVIGRPILTACVDTYSGLCMGYSLGWEGGIYSVNGMLQNMIRDKKEHCKSFGILIDEDAWNCTGFPLTFITDKGSEYKGENFEQITDLGISIDNLPSYRPDLKGPIEKFFDVVQGYFKPYLKGKGIIEPNFMERGARDYRKDASLTIKDFETILLRCIIFYNSQRILNDFPYTEEMLNDKVKPYSSNIWNYQISQYSPLVMTDKKTLKMIMLPRTVGKYTREGLIVNSLRYINKDYKEEFLRGGTVEVSYDANDVTTVFLTENMAPFTIAENRFAGKSLDTVDSIKSRQKELVKREEKNNLQAQIDLADDISAIRSGTKKGKANIKDIRRNRNMEIQHLRAQGE